MGLHLAIRLSIECLHIQLDSNFVVDAINSGRVVQRRQLRLLEDIHIQHLLSLLKDCKLKFIIGKLTMLLIMSTTNSSDGLFIGMNVLVGW